MVLIISILATIATPPMMKYLKRSEANRIQSTIMTSLKLAKTHSYTYRQHVLFCLSDGQGRCHKNAQKETLMFVDKNNNRHFDQTIDLLIYKNNLNLKYANIYLRASAGRHHIKFFADSGTPRGHIGHFKYCPFSANLALTYQVSFNQTGGITLKPHHSHPTGC